MLGDVPCLFRKNSANLESEKYANLESGLSSARDLGQDMCVWPWSGHISIGFPQIGALGQDINCLLAFLSETLAREDSCLWVLLCVGPNWIIDKCLAQLGPTPKRTHVSFPKHPTFKVNGRILSKMAYFPNRHGTTAEEVLITFAWFANEFHEQLWPWYKRSKQDSVSCSGTETEVALQDLKGEASAKPHVYIKSCSHEVAKHKSGVIYRFHLTVPPSPSLEMLLSHCVFFLHNPERVKDGNVTA
jgi:hypothetical protein